jgi:serine/threonine protein kinase
MSKQIGSQTLLEAAVRAYEDATSRLRDSAPAHRQEEARTRGFAWLVFVTPNSGTLQQGWKLHISIGIAQAASSIASLGDELLRLDVSFKIPAILDGIIRLNFGIAGLSQIGKTITVYPRDNEHLARVSEALARVDFQVGPRPPFDLIVMGRPGQSVRYGAFDSHSIEWTNLGRPFSVVVNSTGKRQEDDRSVVARVAQSRPSVPISISPDLSVGNDPIRIGRELYVPVANLSNGARFRVDLATQVSAINTCVVKRARLGVGEDLRGNCASARLKNEARILNFLGSGNCGPRLLQYSAARDILVMSDVQGRPAESVLGAAKLRAIASVAETLSILHAKSVVHRDVKLANAVLVRGRRKAMLLDFELSAIAGEAQPIAGGTPGYIPQEGFCATAHPSYDIFGLGGMIAQWALGIDPSRLPQQDTRRRIRKLLRAAGRQMCAELYSRVTSPTPSRRPTAAKVALFLRDHHSALVREGRRTRVDTHASGCRVEARCVAARALPALNEFVQPSKAGYSWCNNNIFADVACDSINIGSAGILIGLVHLLANGCREQRVWDLIDGTSRRLLQFDSDFRNPGLFTGASGVAVALAVASRCLREPSLGEKAIELILRAARTTRGEWDLFSGAAGVVLAGTMVSSIIHQPSVHAAVAELSERLIRTAKKRRGIPSWKATRAFDPTRRTFIGAAHGASGVALALSKWAAIATDDLGAGKLAREIFTAVYEDSVTARVRNTAETLEGGQRPAQYWCHGVAGYLWCLLQSCPDDAKTQDGIIWSVRCLMNSTPLADLTCLCHGLAGMLETWSLVGQWATRQGNPSLAESSSRFMNQVAHGLLCLAQDRGRDTVWGAEDPNEITPDLWVGFLGPSVALSHYGWGRCGAILSSEMLVESLMRLDCGQARQLDTSAPRSEMK